MLGATIGECEKEVRTLQAAAKGVRDSLTKKRIQEHCARTHARGDDLRHRAAALKSLVTDIDRLRKKGRAPAISSQRLSGVW